MHFSMIILGAAPPPQQEGNPLMVFSSVYGGFPSSCHEAKRSSYPRPDASVQKIEQVGFPSFRHSILVLRSSWISHAASGWMDGLTENRFLDLPPSHRPSPAQSLLTPAPLVNRTRLARWTPLTSSNMYPVIVVCTGLPHRLRYEYVVCRAIPMRRKE